MLDLEEAKKRLTTFIESRMSLLAPNLSVRASSASSGGTLLRINSYGYSHVAARAEPRSRRTSMCGKHRATHAMAHAH
jgi:hypothetical protein